jgi:endonuclease/exonuclease/phosphatase family metal-dependent hydrolase
MKQYCFLLTFVILLLISITTGKAQEINVLSYNIRYASFNNNAENWTQRREGVISILNGRDFIGLQEVLPVQMDDISKGLENTYAYFFRTREADPGKGEGCPVMYDKTRWEVIRYGHFWLSGTPDIPGSNTWDAAFPRMVTFGFFRKLFTGDSILVINTHFDHISQPAREKSIELILEKFINEINIMPVVFMGDLNVTPDNPVYQKIRSVNTLTDSYLNKHPEESSDGATFHGWKNESPVDRIDYIFCSSKLYINSSQVLHIQVEGRYPSDHFPLNTILILKD